MWKELTVDDEKLEYYASLRNIYDCATSYNADNIKHHLNLNRKFYVYKDETYEIVIGIKFNRKYQKSQYVCFVINGFGDADWYREAFKIIGQKTREYLIETNTELVLTFKGIETANPMGINAGTAKKLLVAIRLAFEEVGLTGVADYENHIATVSVINGNS